jgi:hypothetical protein
VKAAIATARLDDSNLHPVIPDQALNLVTRVSDTSGSRQIVRIVPAHANDTNTTDDLDVATGVAALEMLPSERAS